MCTLCWNLRRQYPSSMFLKYYAAMALDSLLRFADAYTRPMQKTRGAGMFLLYFI